MLVDFFFFFPICDTFFITLMNSFKKEIVCNNIHYYSKINLLLNEINMFIQQ